MRKGLIIVGEFILLITVILIVRILLGIFFNEIMSQDVTSFILYFISGLGGFLICRLNMTKKEQ